MSNLALNPALLEPENEPENERRQLRNSNNKTIKKRFNNAPNNAHNNAPNNAHTKSNVQNMMNSINDIPDYTAINDNGPADFNPPSYAELTRMPAQAQQSQAQQSQHAQQIQAQQSQHAQQIQAQQSQHAQQIHAQQIQAQQIQAQQSQHAQQSQQHPVSVNSSKEAFKGLSYSRLNNDNTEYNTEYNDPFVSYYKNSSVTSNGNGSDYKNKDQLIEKLNYMILLLEEQQNERTGHIMEELILYAFLGIFMIFIVDSFVRAGKYVR